MNISIRVTERVLDTLRQFYRFLYMTCTNQVEALRPEVCFVDLLNIQALAVSMEYRVGTAELPQSYSCKDGCSRSIEHMPESCLRFPVFRPDELHSAGPEASSPPKL